VGSLKKFEKFKNSCYDFVSREGETAENEIEKILVGER
jgi:hypothetical protein